MNRFLCSLILYASPWIPTSNMSWREDAELYWESLSIFSIKFFDWSFIIFSGGLTQLLVRSRSELLVGSGSELLVRLRFELLVGSRFELLVGSRSALLLRSRSELMVRSRSELMVGSRSEILFRSRFVTFLFTSYQNLLVFTWTKQTNVKGLIRKRWKRVQVIKVYEWN